jgi:hypothetical protein
VLVTCEEGSDPCVEQHDLMTCIVPG